MNALICKYYTNLDRCFLRINYPTAYNQKSELEGGEKILLAPAVGIEMAVTGLIGLLKPKTYSDLYYSVKTMSNMTWTEWCLAWKGIKFALYNIDDSTKIASLIAVVSSVLFMVGGVAAAQKIIPKLKLSDGLSSKLKRLSSGVGYARTLTYGPSHLATALPAAVIGGTVLDTIELRPKLNYQSDHLGLQASTK